MIHGISGKTGGGKSYEAVVRHIIPVITVQKRKVVTNLPLNVEHFCAVFGEYCRDLIEIVDGQFHNFGGERPFSKVAHYLQYEDWQNEEGLRVYFFIDECHLALPQGSTDKDVREFYSMHRHYGFDIMLITQNFKKVDRDIRDLVGNHYRAIKKSMMGQDDKYILKVHDGASNTNQSVVATHEREYESKYFKFYKSHTKSDTSVKEASPNDIKKWYDNWYFKGSAILILIGVYIVISTLTASDDKPQKLKPVPTNLPGKEVAPGQVVKQQSYAGNPQQVQTLTRVRKEPDEPKKPKHPFYKVNLHISGWMQNLHRGKMVKNYHISASQNGQKVFDIDLADLALAGYKTIVRGQCMIEIQFDDYHDYLTCDVPKVDISPADASPSSDMVASNF